MNTTGRRRTPAKFMPSWQSPRAEAPSPYQATATRFSSRIRKASAQPTATGSIAGRWLTMAIRPSFASAMWTLPSRPRVGPSMPRRSSRSRPASLTSRSEPTGSASLAIAMGRTTLTTTLPGDDLRLRQISHRPADPDREPLPRNATRDRRDGGRPAGRVRAAEEAEGQGGHPLLRRRGGDPGALSHQGALAPRHRWFALRRLRGRGAARLALAQAPRVAGPLDVARGRARRAGDRARPRAIQSRRDPASPDRLRPLRRVRADPVQLRHPPRRQGRRRHGPQVQASRPVRAGPL